MKPVIKWVGGKTQLLPELFKVFPEKIETYYEPFLGGAAVFFALKTDGRVQKACLNDWNPELVNLYSVVRGSPNELIEALREAKANYVKDPQKVYLEVRALELEDPIQKAARTIFLNKTGFNGLFRLNKQGKFNVPWGKKPNPSLCDEENLLACSEGLQGVTLTIGDFAPAVADAGQGDLVYFDPPYLPLSDTANFTSYTEVGFGMADQKRLADTFRQLVERGATCVLSNHDVPAIDDLFSGFEIHRVPARRNINSKGDKRGPVGEVIVVGRPT